MQTVGKKQVLKERPSSISLKKTISSSSLSPYLAGGGIMNSSIQKVLSTLYPTQTIQWTNNPQLPEIDTYVLFYLCAYGEVETLQVLQGIQRAQFLLNDKHFRADAHILIIFYQNVKVAFPERKLQREKVMSNRMTQEVFKREAILNQERISVTHEFGTNNLFDSLYHLTGQHIYFEIMS